MVEFDFENKMDPDVIVITACYAGDIIAQHGFHVSSSGADAIKHLEACKTAEDQLWLIRNEFKMNAVDFVLIDKKLRPASTIFNKDKSKYFTSATGKKIYIDGTGALHENQMQILGGDALREAQQKGKEHRLFDLLPYGLPADPVANAKFPIVMGHSIQLDF